VITTREELRLSFKIAGIVRRIGVNEGEAVRAGQELAILELTEVDAQLEQARQLADKAERDLTRSMKLRADEVISEEELEAIRTQAAVARAGLRAAEFNRNFSTIVAARDGIVLRKLVEDREFVQPGQAVLVVGPKAGGYIVRAALSDRDVVRLRLGDPATVATDAFPGQAFQGKVTVLPGAADSATGLFDIEVELAPAPVRLVSGLSARLESWRSRSARSACTCARDVASPCSWNWRCRRAARASRVASRKSFAVASGNTTLPMSRPSMTTPPPAASTSPAMRRCSATRYERTRGMALIRLEASDTSGSRIASDTSSRPSHTRCSPQINETESDSSARSCLTASGSVDAPRRRNARARARYMAPVSR
jgi:pyruvate/2-oxoglutarate dehydrogenase complex dihydrolipoamide acyltransferase (E2) component